MNLGIYEQLINSFIDGQLSKIDGNDFFVKTSKIDKNEATSLLTNYISKLIEFGLSLINSEDALERKIDLVNKIILTLKGELLEEEFSNDILDINVKILNAVLPKINSNINDFESYIHEITPVTGLVQSELFTGSNAGVSLESEIKKEIASSDRIYFLVSFIKWAGIRIFEKELRDFTSKGKKLKIITTSYMGATDLKAVEFLASLPNTEIKVSYNTSNERLHAKSYLFFRNTGFNTGYIGSSNISKSALTSGLEWNLKVTTSEIPHVINKFEKTFDTYWEDKEFELFTSEHKQKLYKALKKDVIYNTNQSDVFFDIKPFHYQEEILEQLVAQREIHHRYKNLIVSATGTGKTVISAFDYKRFKQSNPKANLLFIAHRKEILIQSRAKFQGVLRDNNFGELWFDGEVPVTNEVVFASVQTLMNSVDTMNLTKDYYDFIIIDEVHHIAAKSYRPILEKFAPKILLGLTATPERMDNENILQDFCNVISAEIRLPEALNRKLLCPFQYFGITDDTDLRQIKWVNGKYSTSELTELFNNDFRTDTIIRKCTEYLTDANDVTAICFCASKLHAQYMSESFNAFGFKSDYLISGSSNRDTVKSQLLKKEINYLFVVDIFNEGIDIPEIDTVLFLRPTESLTIFLQQLGRGLRFSDNKECLTVLDFVGNARDEYDFEGKFRSLVGKTNISIRNEIESEFPNLPLGCSIVLEKKAKQIILSNIKKATALSRKKILHKIANFKHQTSLKLNLNNFLSLNHLDLDKFYNNDSFSKLCFEAGELDSYNEINEREFIRSLTKKWLVSHSVSYFEFILKLINSDFNLLRFTSLEDKQMLMMLYYDFWQDSNMFNSIEEAVKSISLNTFLVDEMKQVLNLLIEKINYIEKDIELPFPCSIKLHSRYTREQILSGFGVNTLDKKKSSREGVFYIKELNTELLFVTLEKVESKYSPTTMYNDYAISDTLFHWQSQNSTKPTSPKGISYINHVKENKNIILFVREANHNENRSVMSFVCLGKVNYKSHEGSQPMNIVWELEKSIPSFLWKNIAKMAIG